MNNLGTDTARIGAASAYGNRSPQPILESLSKGQLAMIAPLGGFGVALLDAWGEVLRECSDFVAERLRQNVATQHALLHCTNPGELQAVQTAWIQTTIDEYLAEAGRLVEITAKLATSATGKSVPA